MTKIPKKNNKKIIIWICSLKSEDYKNEWNCRKKALGNQYDS